MSKVLLLLALGLLLYYVLRAPRVRGGGTAARPHGGPPALPQPMVRCPVCSVHLPKGEAVAGASGRLYCTHDHRAKGGN